MSLSLQASQTHTGSNISRVCQSSYSKCSNNWECRFLPCRDFTSRRTGLDTHYFSTWRRNKFLQSPWADFNVFVHPCLRFNLFCRATDPWPSKRDYTPLYTKCICYINNAMRPGRFWMSEFWGNDFLFVDLLWSRQTETVTATVNVS